MSKSKAPTTAASFAGAATFSNNGSSPNVSRTTIVLPLALDQNLELYAVRVGASKNDVIKKVLADFLVQQGMQPFKTPKSVEVTY